MFDSPDPIGTEKDVEIDIEPNIPLCFTFYLMLQDAYLLHLGSSL